MVSPLEVSVDVLSLELAQIGRAFEDNPPEQLARGEKKSNLLSFHFKCLEHLSHRQVANKCIQERQKNSSKLDQRLGRGWLNVRGQRHFFHFAGCLLVLAKIHSH